MRTLIERLAAPRPLHGRNPVSIAFALVRLGWFEDIEQALALVDSIIGNVSFRRN